MQEHILQDATICLNLNYTTLESCFERLCTSLPLVRPAVSVHVLSVNYKLLCAGIITLNHNEYKTIKLIGYGTTMKKYLLSLVGISSGKYLNPDKHLLG